MRKSRVVILAIVGGGFAVGAIGYAYYRWTYPYGHSHCCIKHMMFALEAYADDHHGRYPAGESSPEASLSLLYRAGHVDPDILRGKSVPKKTVERALVQRGVLGSDSCGWHYVEGLTQADDRRLAILWDKVGLGHNGQRTKDGAREVVFVGGGGQWISGEKWQAFLIEQAEFRRRRSVRAKAGAPLYASIIQLPDGTQIDNVDGPYTLENKSRGSNSSGSGTESGIGLGRSAITWYHAPIEAGSITYTLSFSNLVSKPVTVSFEGGTASPSNIVFIMEGR